MEKLLAHVDLQPLGYKAKLARAIGRAPSYLSRQLGGSKPFTERDCINIEKFTEGAVRCEDILPDVDWAYLRGSACAKPQPKSRRAATATPTP